MLDKYSFPPTQLELLQKEQKRVEFYRARFAAEVKACLPLGPAFDAEAHLDRWHRYVLTMMDGGGLVRRPHTILSMADEAQWTVREHEVLRTAYTPPREEKS